MKLPAFLITDDGTVWFIKAPDELSRGDRMLMSIYKGGKGQRALFDADLVSWFLKDVRWTATTPWWRRWFATPLSQAEFDLMVVDPKPYTLDDWKAKFLVALEKDDDVLCQNQEKEDIAEKVMKARRFSNFVWIWNWLQRDAA